MLDCWMWREMCIFCFVYLDHFDDLRGTSAAAAALPTTTAAAAWPTVATAATAALPATAAATARSTINQLHNMRKKHEQIMIHFHFFSPCQLALSSVCFTLIILTGAELPPWPPPWPPPPPPCPPLEIIKFFHFCHNETKQHEDTVYITISALQRPTKWCRKINWSF